MLCNQKTVVPVTNATKIGWIPTGLERKRAYCIDAGIEMQTLHLTEQACRAERGYIPLQRIFYPIAMCHLIHIPVVTKDYEAILIHELSFW
jgi:hypothetical protein